VKDQARILGWDEVGTVKAAGGVVTRPGPAGLVELVVVHRPGYEDWTLPKGKLDAGETAEEGARREVEEETGYVCELVRPVGCTQYVDRKGRPKVVCYWEMRIVSGSFRPSLEVDQLRWLTVAEAIEILTYARDHQLLEAFAGPGEVQSATA
jgi:8-oxo-dGTP diphosphatase